ncbi:MAG: hypothetical protein RLZZ505_1772 [Verrucomicrobiota bacterium]|jgi:hypothetical protein
MVFLFDRARNSSTLPTHLRRILNKDTMHRSPFILLLCCLTAMAQEPEPTVAALRETISKIVDTQTLESRERTDWEARKAEFAALLELHRKEIALLDEELEKAGKSAPGHGESTDAMKAEIESLKETRRFAKEAVARNVPRAITLTQRFPDPLKKDCEVEIASLTAWRADDEPREALQSILSVLAKAQQFDRRLTRATEIRDGREVDVLYLGLARAFYADKKQSSGIGEPGADGWKWTTKPEIRAELLAAFDTLDKKRPPSMVRLPLEIQ